MKNLFRSIIALSLVLALMTPLGMQTLAAEKVTITEISTGDLVDPQAVDLILSYALTAYKKSNTRLTVDIELNCVPSVVRCGVKSVHLEERSSSSADWENSLTLDNYLVDDNTFDKEITFAVNKGYQYRLTVTYYAKKAWYSIQKKDYASNVVKI